jgi:predicted metal-dependent RNase
MPTYRDKEVSSWSRTPVLFFKDVTKSEDKDKNIASAHLYTEVHHTIEQPYCRRTDLQSDIKLVLGRRP